MIRSDIVQLADFAAALRGQEFSEKQNALEKQLRTFTGKSALLIGEHRQLFRHGRHRLRQRCSIRSGDTASDRVGDRFFEVPKKG